MLVNTIGVLMINRKGEVRSGYARSEDRVTLCGLNEYKNDTREDRLPFQILEENKEVDLERSVEDNITRQLSAQLDIRSQLGEKGFQKNNAHIEARWNLQGLAFPSGLFAFVVMLPEFCLPRGRLQNIVSIRVAGQDKQEFSTMGVEADFSEGQQSAILTFLYSPPDPSSSSNEESANEGSAVSPAFSIFVDLDLRECEETNFKMQFENWYELVRGQEAIERGQVSYLKRMYELFAQNHATMIASGVRSNVVRALEPVQEQLNTIVKELTKTSRVSLIFAFLGAGTALGAAIATLAEEWDSDTEAKTAAWFAVGGAGLAVLAVVVTMINMCCQRCRENSTPLVNRGLRQPATSVDSQQTNISVASPTP